MSSDKNMKNSENSDSEQIKNDNIDNQAHDINDDDAVENDISNDEHEAGDDSIISSEDSESENNTELEDANGDSDLPSLLDKANAKADDNWEQLLRTKAEMENLRRRSRLDIENAHKFAVEKFVSDLIPVLDSLELGLTAVGKDDHEQLEKLREGTELTLKMFQDVCNKFEIETINPLNEVFNPELHQAMVMQESDEVAPNTVIMVMQKGYTLNERLIRPAMVTVSKASVATPDQKGEKIDEQA